MTRSEYYLTAAKNLGFFPFLHFEYQKRIGHFWPFKLRSKNLTGAVYARPKSSDLAVFYQIFVFDEYRCMAGLREPRLIVDLGANVGYSSAYFLSRFKDCRVIAIEPDPDNFRQLQKNVRPYSDRITTIQAAIWPTAERLDMHHPGIGAEWGVKVAPSNDGTVDAVTMPQILGLAGRDRISLLKIDIEGAEIELFKSDTSWLDAVDNLVIELHGEEAEQIFFSKIDKSRFTISRCDELTVCSTLSTDDPAQDVWHKCLRAPVFAQVEGNEGVGQLWRRKVNGKWEYKRDPETVEDAESRWW